jgi:amino acid adenylation domain-containing protein/non-ribosomal peptide synthase protein (TIGR01720 family)
MHIDEYSQNIIISSVEFEGDKNYWLAQLEGGVVPSGFPADFQRKGTAPGRSETLKAVFPEEVSQKILRMANNSVYGVYLILLSAVLCLLRKYTGNEDLAIGIPVFKQNTDAAYINNVLILRQQIEGAVSFKDCLLGIQKTVREAGEHQNFPFEVLLKLLNLSVGADPRQFFDVLVMMENMQERSLISDFQPKTLFSFVLSGSTVELSLDYQSDCYQPQTMEQLLRHLLTFIGKAAAGPAETLSGLEILTNEERRRILEEFNDTKADYVRQKTMHQLFEEQTGRTPENVALICEGRTLTYQQLNEQANRLAGLLKDKGLNTGDFTAVICERSLEMVIAIMGIIKAGGVYVPFEPAFPKARIQNILADLKIGIVITQYQFLRTICEFQWYLPELTEVVLLDVETEQPLPEELNSQSVKALWDHVAANATDRVTAAGFVSSYTGNAFPEAEVDQYRDYLVNLVQPYLRTGARVLEIGCGSGLLMFAIAKQAGCYVGLDPSELTQRRNREYAAANGYTNLELHTGFAHEISGLKLEPFDVIILASTIQFFPGFIYLEQVLTTALGLLKPGGTILAADVVDPVQKEDFRLSLENYISSHPQDQHRTKIDLEGELYVHENFFRSFKAGHPELAQIEALYRNITFSNELRYRYDLLLTKAVTPGQPSGPDQAAPFRRNFWTNWHVQRYPGDNLLLPIPAEALAYVIYTSGSTGVPKGVMIQHRPVINLIEWIDRNFHLAESDRLLFVTSLCFDLSVYDVFGMLASGGSIRIATRHELHHPEKMMDILCHEPITFWDSAPAALQQLVPFLPEANSITPQPRLRLVFLSGDWIPVPLPDKLRGAFPGVKVISLGGATEATVWSNYYPIGEVDPEWPSIPYGKPIANARYYILDADYHPCPIGLPGDLYIGGECLALGYVHDPDLTASKFIPDPFNPAPGARMYRTGDLARWFSDGNMEFLGRKDFQVKIRGYRIELGEVESQLLKHPLIKEAVVIARDDDLAQVRAKYLCAYFTAGGKIQHAELREHLLLTLPDYMVPTYFVQLDQIPVTGNGKVNRQALPNPKSMKAQEKAYVPPRTEPERILAEAWQEVLGIEQAGIEDNFFELGGDSIKAIRIISNLSQYNLQLELDKLLECQTISAVSEFIKTATVQIDQGMVTGDVPLTPVQAWFWEQKPAGGHHFNQAMFLYREAGFDPEVTRQVFQKIVEHHDALRMVFQNQNGRVVQTNRDRSGDLFDLAIIDLKGLNASGLKPPIEQAANKFQQTMVLEQGPLVKLGLFQTDTGDHLLIIIHHLVIDAVSWRIILADFTLGYQQASQHQAVEFQPKTTSFKEWSLQLQSYATSSQSLNELSYWTKLAEAQTPVLPEDRTPESNTMKDGCYLTFTISKDNTALLKQEAHHAYNTDINDLLLTALAVTMKEWAGIDQVLVNLEGHGRENIIPNVNLTRTVGWFTSMYPVFLDLTVSDDLAYQIKYLKETIRRMPNKGIGYGILRYLTSASDRDGLGLDVQPELSFNYLGDFDQDLNTDVFRISDFPAGETISPEARRLYRLDINCLIVSGVLQFTVNYNAKQYQVATMERFTAIYQQSLQKIIQHCLNREQTELTPTDVGYKELSLDELDYITGLFEES